MDRVRLEGFRIDADVGVYAFEKGIAQVLEIDVTAHVDLEAAARSDRLSSTVDYDSMAACCRRVVAEAHHDLIETIAMGIAEGVLLEHPDVSEVEVRVAKPGAVPQARNVAVEVRRLRR